MSDDFDVGMFVTAYFFTLKDKIIPLDDCSIQICEKCARAAYLARARVRRFRSKKKELDNEA